MAKQLIFASVPHGLQPGRSGYCFVAGHTDLPQTLIKQLEQETSVFPDREDSHAPRHEIRKIGGSEWHLFLKQTVGIKDYTGRRSGITHVIAERAEAFHGEILPETVISHFTDWVVSPPEVPSIFGEDEEINLQSLAGKNGGITPESQLNPPSETTAEDKDEGFRLNKSAQPERPAPRPRSGIYYEAREKRNANKWWIGLGIVLFITVLIMVF